MFNVMEFLFNHVSGNDAEARSYITNIVMQYNAENIRKGYLPYGTASGCARMIDNSEYRQRFHRDSEVMI